MKIAEPLNNIQERFNALCDIGGGKKGGPEKQAVQALLKEGGAILNDLGHTEICKHLATDFVTLIEPAVVFL